MSNMSDKEWEAHLWLARMWDADNEIESYEKRKDDILSQLSGIGKYDSEFVPAQTGENSVETKNIEYSLLNEKIEKLINEISVENVRTLQVLFKLNDAKMRNMLYDRYINRMSWAKIGEKYHYAQRQPYRYRKECLSAVRPLIPDEWIREVCYGK